MVRKQQGIKFVCDFCGRLIEIGRPRFIFKGELFCAYDGGTFDESIDAEAGVDFKAEFARLIAAAEKRSEKELSDEVHYAFELDLCSSCRKQVYLMLERSNQK